MKEEEREPWEAIKEGISTLEENGNWIKEGRRIEKKKENSEETRMTTDRMSEARGGDLPEASRREEERVLEIQKMSGSLNRKSVSQSEIKQGRLEVRKNL